MKIIDKNGNNIIGTPNLKRGEEYQIQIDFTEAIVNSYEERWLTQYESYAWPIDAIEGGIEGSRWRYRGQ